MKEKSQETRLHTNLATKSEATSLTNSHLG